MVEKLEKILDNSAVSIQEDEKNIMINMLPLQVLRTSQ